ARALVAAHLRAPPGTGPDRKLGIPAPGPASLDRRVARTIKAHRAAAACVARVSEAHPGSALAAEQGVGEWIGKPIRRLIAVVPVRRPRMRPSALSGLQPVLLPPAPFPPCCPSGGPAARPASAPSPPAPPDPRRSPAPCHAACVARVSEAHPGSRSRRGTMGRRVDWRADTAADRGGGCSPAPDAAFGLIRATARYYSRASASPPLPPAALLRSAASQRPVSASASRSTPVSSPMPRGL